MTLLKEQQILRFAVIISILISIKMIATTRAADPASATYQQPPNIIMIMADDMGFDDVSFRGSKEFLTPNIDALAYHGKILDHLYAPAMCTPSRSALLTGRYPIHTGTQHFVISNEEPWSLPTNFTTLAQIFQQAGYSTNLIGKWHLGFAKKEFTPTYRGFDYHYGYWGGYIDYYQRRSEMPLGETNLGFDFRRNTKLECDGLGTYVTDLFTNEAERIIRSNNGTQPLLLLLNHLAPHTANKNDPLQAPKEEVQKFAYIKNPLRRKYAAMISKLDKSIGRVIHALERSAMLDNSIIIFYSDNGAPAAGQFANSGTNWPFRGQKNTPWEGGVRVAGAIWSPLLANRSSIFPTRMYVGDWLPTLATAAGISLDTNLAIDGLDMWAQLTDAATNDNKEREIVHFLDDIYRVVSYMRGSWKYINGTTHNGVNDNLLTYRELYDLDPRDQRYAVEIRNSPTSKALSKYDAQRLTMNRIERLRRDAAVNCGNLQRSCNALIEECLFNLDSDPCERNNLAAEPNYKPILNEMREQVRVYRRSAWPIQNQNGSIENFPQRHNCAWSNFLDEPASKEPLICAEDGHPCYMETAL